MKGHRDEGRRHYVKLVSAPWCFILNSYKLVILVLPCWNVLRADNAPDRRRRVGVPATAPGAASCSPSTEAATEGGLLAVDSASNGSPELSTARSSCARSTREGHSNFDGIAEAETTVSCTRAMHQQDSTSGGCHHVCAAFAHRRIVDAARVHRRGRPRASLC